MASIVGRPGNLNPVRAVVHELENGLGVWGRPLGEGDAGGDSACRAAAIAVTDDLSLVGRRGPFDYQNLAECAGPEAEGPVRGRCVVRGHPEVRSVRRGEDGTQSPAAAKRACP